jgi:hypothetical protein
MTVLQPASTTPEPMNRPPPGMCRIASGSRCARSNPRPAPPTLPAGCTRSAGASLGSAPGLVLEQPFGPTAQVLLVIGMAFAQPRLRTAQRRGLRPPSGAFPPPARHPQSGGGPPRSTTLPRFIRSRAVSQRHRHSLNWFYVLPHPDVDSLAPARSALAGIRLHRIPFAASQAAQVSPRSRRIVGRRGENSRSPEFAARASGRPHADRTMQTNAIAVVATPRRR